jgi:hypothetical protein
MLLRTLIGNINPLVSLESPKFATAGAEMKGRTSNSGHWLAARIDFMYPFSDETLALPDQHWTNSRPGCLRAPGKFRLNFA